MGQNFGTNNQHNCSLEPRHSVIPTLNGATGWLQPEQDPGSQQQASTDDTSRHAGAPVVLAAVVAPLLRSNREAVPKADKHTECTSRGTVMLQPWLE